MGIQKESERIVHLSVLNGEMRIDPDGTIWRLAARRFDRWSGQTRSIPCKARRAENKAGPYLQIRTMFNGQRAAASAHRLVWHHFRGPIPSGLTINHINGDKMDNRPENLELASHSEQVIHALLVLKKMSQVGERNNNSKLSDQDVEVIRARRATGEKLKAIAADFGVSDRQVSRIALGLRRALPG